MLSTSITQGTAYLARPTSMAVLLMVVLVLLLSPQVAMMGPPRQPYHVVHVYAHPRLSRLSSKSTVRVTCTAEAPYEVPYVSFWQRLPRGFSTWLSDEDAGVSIREVGLPGNRTVSLDLWIGPSFYHELAQGPNLFSCRGTTMDHVTGITNFTITRI